MRVKQYMDVVEAVMGKPFKHMPRTYPWSAKNIFKAVYGEARSLGKNEDAVSVALYWTEQFLEDKTPFSFERNNLVVLATEEVPLVVQALYNIHELTHAYGHQHWPGRFALVDQAISKNANPKIIEQVFVEKILDEGLAEYVSLRTKNPVAREREGLFLERLEEESITPEEIAEIVKSEIEMDVFARYADCTYLLGYGLMETVMQHGTPWEQFDKLINNQPSLSTIGKLIDPAVYEVKE